MQEQFSGKNIAVLGHGRKHQQIYSIPYNKDSRNDSVLFLDQDEKVDPDIVIDIHTLNIDKPVETFDKIYTANNATMVLTDGEKLLPNVIISVYNMLKINGLFITQCPDLGLPRKDKKVCEDKFTLLMSSYGFVRVKDTGVIYECAFALGRPPQVNLSFQKIQKMSQYKFFGSDPSKKGWMFSNFSAHPVKAYGKVWATSEHLFQALKFRTTDKEYYEKIFQASSPNAAKKLGKSKQHPLRKDWEKIKDDLMFSIVFLKVSQNPQVRDELLSIDDDVEIIENSPWDSYWGIGRSGKGRNQLGKTLMKIRDILKMQDTIREKYFYTDSYVLDRDGIILSIVLY